MNHKTKNQSAIESFGYSSISGFEIRNVNSKIRDKASPLPRLLPMPVFQNCWQHYQKHTHVHDGVPHTGNSLQQPQVTHSSAFSRWHMPSAQLPSLRANEACIHCPAATKDAPQAQLQDVDIACVSTTPSGPGAALAPAWKQPLCFASVLGKMILIITC